MKITFNRCILMSLAAGATFAATSCETTGDPTQGGIFWSENKAQARLAERQDKLERTESGTRSINRKSAQTQKRIDELR